MDEVVPDEYHQLKQEYLVDLSDMTAANVRQYEELEYDSALKSFEKELRRGLNVDTDAMRQLYAKGGLLLDHIKAEQQSSRADQFDMKFHTRVMKAALDVLQHPEQAEHQQCLAALAEQNNCGKRDSRKIKRGLVLMLLGAAIIAGSVMLAWATFGIASAIMIAGVTLGGTLVLGGAALCAHARQKDLDKSLKGYQQLSMFYQRQQPEAEAAETNHQTEVVLTL
jgi:CHASE3 domain sensor protein